jgi:hypothetical protein
MKRARAFTMTFVATGLITLGTPPLDAQLSAGTAPKITEEKSAEPGPPGAGAEQGRQKKKRRSSGRQITEEATTNEKAKPGDGTSKRSEGGSAAKRSEIGSGGGGVTGAVGR